VSAGARARAGARAKRIFLDEKNRSIRRFLYSDRDNSLHVPALWEARGARAREPAGVGFTVAKETTAMDRDQGIQELLEFMAPFRASMSEWYVGTTHEPYRRIFNDHRVPPDYKAHTCLVVESADTARAIESFFLENVKTDGGQGGGDENSRFVYAFLKTNGTYPPLGRGAGARAGRRGPT